MATKLFAGFLYNNAGTAIEGATVELFPRNTTTTATTSTTTSSTGYWAMTTTTENRYDVRVTSGSSIRYIKYDTSAQMTALEVADFRIRNPANTFEYDVVPGAIVADRQLNLPVITGTDTVAVLGLAQTFSAAQTFTSTVTVGANTDGNDVKFFGATSGQFVLWDESADELVLAGDTKLSFHDAAGGENIIASANGHLEINAGTTLDITAPTVDLNSSTEFNIDTAAFDLNVDDAVTVDATGISLDSDAASNFTTSSGALTLTSAAAATWSTAAGALTLTSAAAATWSTAAGALTLTSAAAATWSTGAGALTLNGTGGVAIQEGGAAIISISDGRALSTSNTATVDLDASGAIQVNSSGGALSIGNDNVDQAINIGTGGTRTLTLGIDDGTDLTTVVIKGPVFIGDTANAEMTRGLTINQGAADDMTFVLKSSDINHGMTTLPTGQDLEVDDWMTIQKNHENVGGVRINAIGEVSAEIGMQVIAFAGPPTTSDTSASRGVIAYFVVRHDGSNGYVAPATDSNGYSWGVADGDGNYLTKMLLKADDGELHLQDTTLVALDTEDDILVTRGLQKASGTGFIDSIYDKHNPFNDYDKLRELKLVGPKDEFGDHLFPLQPRLTLHEGALWQLFEDLMSVVVSLPEAQKNCLNPRLKSRLLALEA